MEHIRELVQFTDRENQVEKLEKPLFIGRQDAAGDESDEVLFVFLFVPLMDLGIYFIN
jgi:hypothetical protein